MIESISVLSNVILDKNVEDFFSDYIDLQDPFTSYSLLLKNILLTIAKRITILI